MSEYVGVGVPAYRGVAYVAETLRCLEQQTHRNLDVLISVDGADEETAAVCTPFIKDSRFKITLTKVDETTTLIELLKAISGDSAEMKHKN